MAAIADTLVNSRVPSVRLAALTRVLGLPSSAPKVRAAQRQVRESPLVRKLLANRDRHGRIRGHPYAKWYGAHWVLAALADLGYPPGDNSLIPLREQVYEWILEQKDWPKMVAGLARLHASQEANAIFYLHSLGIADRRVEHLVNRLLECQWPDGGWNCDLRARGLTSSFMETAIPLRALALHARVCDDRRARRAAVRAAEVFLSRRLFRRRRDGAIISEHFLRLHYPCYWHYDILFGLKILAEAGLIRDRRCAGALDLLESKRLAGGGFPAEERYYFVGRSGSGRSPVDWGGCSKRRMNEFVTIDALYVLSQAGRNVAGAG